MIENLPLFFGSSSEEMPEVSEGTVQTIVTSPPYYDLKDYGHKDQIGASDQSYDQFLSRLDTVWDECYQKLRSDGCLWIVVDTTMDRNGELRILPQDIVDRTQDIGFRHRDTVVWYKPTSLARMNPRLLANKKEYILLLSKSNEIKFNHNISTDNNVEDPGIRNERSKLGDLWRFPVKRGSLGGNVLHKAPFPIKLVKRMIRLSTDPNDTVLDPFLGSGTTAQAALELGRRVIGYEVNPDFEAITEDRLSEVELQ